MQLLKERVFEGERALFKSDGLCLYSCVFRDGESPLKESKNIRLDHCAFQWKYPLWYCRKIMCEGCLFDENSRAGIWYTRNARFYDCTYHGAKLFRKCRDIEISGGNFIHGEETFWWNNDVRISNVRIQGDYAFMRCKKVTAEQLFIDGNYCFDSCEDVVLRDCVLNTKDAFWNCKNVTCINCVITCEYFGWNSKNVTLINCTVSSHQGFCYMKGIRLTNCILDETDLAFEYCEDIDADIQSRIISIKNPISGRIRCKGYDELILDDDDIDHSKTVVEVHG